MGNGPSRREFIEATGLAIGIGGLAGGATADAAEPSGLPKIAAVVTVYHYLSHAYHIVGRFLDGFVLYDQEGGGRLHRPAVEIVSLFIEQTPEETDLGQAKAKRHGVRLSPTIADALTLGGDSLAVDGVLLIGEHGDYPVNEKLQKLYPRYRFFQEIDKVFERSGKAVPVFNDKHLSYRTDEALAMVNRARSRKFPMMAGSSLPVTWRMPELEVPLGLPWKDALVVSRGDIEVFGFHALETLQCMVERRDRKGKPQGVSAVTYLEGDAVWEAGDQGRWSRDLFQAAVGRSHTLNPGDPGLNVKDYRPPTPKEATTRFPYPLAFLVEYADGFNGTAMIINGHVDDTTIAARVGTDPEKMVSTLVYLPAPPGARFFDPLVLRIEDFFRSGKPPYPVERTLLTGGALDAGLESRARFKRSGKPERVETPALASVDYEAPADSGFIRSAVAAASRSPF